MRLKIRNGRAVRSGGWESLIEDKTHKPKAMGKIYMTALKKIKPKPQIAVRKLEATRPAPGWDYGVYAIYDITLANGDTVGCAFMVRTAVDDNQESSGTAQLDANYGGIISTQRGKEPVSVAKQLAKAVADHLSKVGAK